jgi:hypothetical protein
LDLKLLNRLITTFDEVPPYLLNAIHIANNDGVTYVNVYRRSLSSSLNTLGSKSSVIETRKDSAVHVSLSSSSLVKQPGILKSHSHDWEPSICGSHHSSFDGK